MPDYSPMFPLLCTPLHIGPLTLRNRICSAPMGFPDLTEDGCLTDGAIAFYENRAKGGAAVVTISEACVDYVNGKGHGRLINLQNPGVLANLTNAARAIRRHGALASIEINHAGMCSDFDVVKSERTADNKPHYGPSDMVLPDGTAVMAMTEQQIAEVVEQFRRGAALIKRAGFDMLMVHAGHGWLIHQFLSPATNHRSDRYGGDLTGRARLACEILDAIRSAVGKDFPIEVRFSAMENAPDGITLKDAAAFAELIQDKVDILHVSAGGEPDFGVTHPSMFAEPGCNVHFAAEIKKHVHIPVATVGALNEPEQMEDILRSGQADLVCPARALLADPELPKKVEQNRPDEILRCMRCFVCHAERMLTQTRVCAVNPEIGREIEAKFTPPLAPVSKTVLIAGGGPAGMQSALTAARRGHKVILCEKTNALGGRLKAEENVSFKAAFPKYIRTMTLLMKKSGVEILLNTEVTPALVREISPDALLIAVGAEPAVPPIPGIDRPNVIMGTELREKEMILGHKVAVLGGGQVGCEEGLHLAMAGHEVTIIEMRDGIAVDANPRHRPLLLQELAGRVTVRTGLQASAVEEGALVCKDKGGNLIRIPADSVLCAAGMKTDFAAVDVLRGLVAETSVIGDADHPANIRTATFRGYHAALDL